MVAEKPKKYIRTQVKLDSGEIVDARICIAIGEIKSHKYPTANPQTRAKALPIGETNGLAEDPPWVRIPVPVWKLKEGKGDRLWKTKTNPNGELLKGFLKYSDAIEDYPVLENLMVGTTTLGDGHLNPISKGSLFNQLRDLPEISVKTVKEYTGHSESYCYKLAQHLRVLSEAFDREIKRSK